MTRHTGSYDPWTAPEEHGIWMTHVELGDNLRVNDLAGGLPLDERPIVWRILDVLACNVGIALAVGAFGLLLMMLD